MNVHKGHLVKVSLIFSIKSEVQHLLDLLKMIQGCIGSPYFHWLAREKIKIYWVQASKIST